MYKKKKKKHMTGGGQGDSQGRTTCKGTHGKVAIIAGRREGHPAQRLGMRADLGSRPSSATH